MKLIIKHNETSTHRRLNIFKKEVPCLDTEWHYHPEYELLYITQSNGIRFVGDNVAHFSPGDLVLVGSYLPHLWRNDLSYYKDKKEIRVKTIISKFTRDFIGTNTFDNPEFIDINNLLSESSLGISFSRKVSEYLHNDLIELSNLSFTEQSIKLLGILHKLSKVKDKVLLSTTDMRQFAKQKSNRINDVITYISNNYTSSIRLDDVADIACMTTNSFCRFFKRMTNKSFSEFLNEIRIRNASRLLIQDDLLISQVCYEVGYNSITNFNKQFKKIIGSSPNNYRRNFRYHLTESVL